MYSNQRSCVCLSRCFFEIRIRAVGILKRRVSVTCSITLISEPGNQTLYRYLDRYIRPHKCKLPLSLPLSSQRTNPSGEFQHICYRYRHCKCITVTVTWPKFPRSIYRGVLQKIVLPASCYLCVYLRRCRNPRRNVPPGDRFANDNAGEL